MDYFDKEIFMLMRVYKKCKKLVMKLIVVEFIIGF